ncbi:MAG: DMT family transporter [Proteobacteria bacterium]|nr:DMT family transporter [Pseudomonadota bacterium]
MGREKQLVGERIRGYKAVVMLIGAMSLAGSSVVVGKMLVATVPVFVAAFGSLLVAFVCILPLMLGRFGELRLLTGREWRYLFLQGLCGIVLFRVFTLYGLHMTGAVQAGIITGATPAVLAVLSLLLLGERISGRMAAGIVLAALGCMLINIFSLGGSGENNALGSLLVGAAVVSEALFTIFRKRICHSVSATTNTAVLIFCSLLLLAVPAAIQFRVMNTSLSLEAILAIVYYGVFATVLAYLLWTAAVGQVSGSTAGAATAAMPASSVILALVVLGEPPHWHQLAGCLLIITGILITSGGRPDYSGSRS